MPEQPVPVDLRSVTPTKQLTMERWLAAPPERVFHAFTESGQIKSWWWPKGFRCPAAEVDLRVGGHYRIAMEWPEFIQADARFSHYLAGEYYEIDRPRRLVMSGRAVNEEQGELFATLIELTFEPHEGGTALTMRQSYFDPLPPPEAMSGAEQGWSEQLDKLRTLLQD
ncbi:MAG: SRPBCC domain-containing protein [Candidatus Dormibacteraeota bacterium]|nr:SRPBCC domain-containing protein [Candidatus Dormibacteraeota bacterium]